MIDVLSEASVDQFIYQNYIPGYGEIIVADSMFHDRMTRLLYVDGAMQSATYNEPGERNDLIFEYMKAFDDILLLRPDAADVLLIGGGAMSYPKHFVNSFPDKHLDVAELCPEMVEIARRFFYFGQDIESRMGLYLTDGDTLLSETGKSYDIIMNDAYIGSRWDKAIAGSRHCRLIKKRLSPTGIYVLNVITSQKGFYSMRGRKLISSLQRFFKRTLLIPCQEESDYYGKQNCLIIASDGELYTQ